MKKIVSGMVWGSMLFFAISSIYYWLIANGESSVIEVLVIMNMFAFLVFIGGLWLTLKLYPDPDNFESSVGQ
jgi:hypothetical protein